MTYRTAVPRPDEDLTEAEARRLAEEVSPCPVDLSSEYPWGWVYVPSRAQGQAVAYGPGEVSVTRRGHVLQHGSVPYPFSDDREPVDRFAPRGGWWGRLRAAVRRRFG